MGILGLSEQELYDTTWRSLWNRLGGFYKLEEQRFQSDWERTRWQTTLFLNCYTTKGKTVKPKDLIVFPWEEEQKKKKAGRKLTPEEIRQKFSKMDALMKKRHGKQR